MEYGWPEEKIETKGNFVNHVEHIDHVEKKDQIVYVGRLSKEKGVETLLKAFKIILHAPTCSTWLNNLKLVIVGDGVDRAELEELANGLDVEFVGLKPGEEVRRLMSESKATVLPSEWWETFGLTVVESMLEGTPVVTSNLGALPEIVQEGLFGEVFEDGNAEACAAAIKRLLTRSDYGDMCVTAKHEAETKYSEGANYRRLMEIYGTVVCG